MKRQFRLPIEPCPASRPKIPRFGKPYYEGRYKLFREKAPALIDQVWGQLPLTSWLRVTVDVLVTRPKKPANPYPSPDWDNYAKAVCDGMNKRVYHDDKQIVVGTCSKAYAPPGEEGHILVTIEELHG